MKLTGMFGLVSVAAIAVMAFVDADTASAVLYKKQKARVRRRISTQPPPRSKPTPPKRF